MLALTVLPGESIYVGNIRVMYVERRGDRVKLGIEAPADVPVDREKIRESKLRDAAKAAGESDG